MQASITSHRNKNTRGPWHPDTLFSGELDQPGHRMQVEMKVWKSWLWLATIKEILAQGLRAGIRPEWKSSNSTDSYLVSIGMHSAWQVLAFKWLKFSIAYWIYLFHIKKRKLGNHQNHPSSLMSFSKWWTSWSTLNESRSQQPILN